MKVILCTFLGHALRIGWNCSKVLWKYSLFKFFMTGVSCSVCRARVYLLYPCQRSCGGVVVSPWLVCFRLWKSGFCTITPFPFRLTIKILHTCVDHDPRRTSSDFGVKGQSQIWTSNFLPFPHNNSISFWLKNDGTSHMCWPWPKEDFYWVWSQKVKGHGQIDFKFFTVCTITPFPCGIHWWYLTHELTITWGRPQLILGQKVKFGLQTFYNFHTITDFQFDIQWWYFTHVFPMTGATPLLILGWKGHVFTLNFASFLHDNSITFWHTMMILYAWIHHDSKRTSIDYCVNMSKVKV